ACCFSRNVFTCGCSLGSSTLIVIISKSRLLSRRDSATSSGNSPTQGAHHVAHTLIRRRRFESFFASRATPAASVVSSSTGSAFHFSSARATSSRFVFHLVEQPATIVVGFVTGLPASISSIALRAS